MRRRQKIVRRRETSREIMQRKEKVIKNQDNENGEGKKNKMKKKERDKQRN